jgi:hypothetical protein
VEIAYRKYELERDELGLKTKIVKLIYAEFLKGSVERKPLPGATPPQFFCEILVYGKIERVLKFEKSLRALYPGIPLRCIVLLAGEFVQLDEGILAKLVKTGEKIVVADILRSSHFFVFVLSSEVGFHREDSSGCTNELFRGQRDIERLGGEASWWDNVSATPSVKS